MLVTLGLLAVWFVAYALGLSGLQERADQRVLYGQLREQLALATAPVGGAISPGAPIAVLQIPALGVSNDVVVEGTSSSALRLGPGHRRDTPLPGQAGVSLVYGRSVTFGAPFRNLSALGPKDTIVVTTGQGEFTYVVDSVRRPGDPLPPPPAADQGRLTLVSAEGSGRLASFTASDTVFVDATMQGKVQPVLAGRPASVGDAETSMGSDTSGLVALVLWLEALVLVAVGVVWAARRWGGWQTWVVSVPVVLAVLWGTTSVAFGLLPNLL
ncbi:MAG: sortase [Actinomycetes bacterium]